MYEHTTTELAEYLGLQRQSINKYIKDGRLKATYKTKMNSEPKYYISHKEYTRFCDWYLSCNRYSNCGVKYKKIPCIDEYDLEPDKYNSYQSLKIQRDKTILEGKYLSSKKVKNLALEFNLKIVTIQSIIGKYRKTNFVKELIKMRDISK